MIYFYNGRQFDTAAEALASSLYDYVQTERIPDRSVRSTRDRWRSWRDRALEMSATSPGTLQLRWRPPQRLVWHGVYLHGDPCRFSQDDVRSAFLAVADRLQRELDSGAPLSSEVVVLSDCDLCPGTGWVTRESDGFILPCPRNCLQIHPTSNPLSHAGDGFI